MNRPTFSKHPLRHLFTLPLTALLLVASVTLASANETPTVGDTAPDFALPDLQGSEVKLSTLRESGPVVFVMLRGWPGYQCPICTRQVGEFIQNAAALQEKGATVLLVYPGPSENLTGHGQDFLKKTTLPENFRFVLDAGYTVTNLYGLRWDQPGETAYPSTFVLSPEGKVLYAKVSEGHGGRAAAKDVLAALE